MPETDNFFWDNANIIGKGSFGKVHRVSFFEY